MQGISHGCAQQENLGAHFALNQRKSRPPAAADCGGPQSGARGFWPQRIFAPKASNASLYKHVYRFEGGAKTLYPVRNHTEIEPATPCFVHPAEGEPGGRKKVQTHIRLSTLRILVCTLLVPFHVPRGTQICTEFVQTRILRVHMRIVVCTKNLSPLAPSARCTKQGVRGSNLVKFGTGYSVFAQPPIGGRARPYSSKGGRHVTEV